MKIFYIPLIALLVSVSGVVSGQVGVSHDGSVPDPSAGLDVNFTDRGLLLPRLSSVQIRNIWQPAAGLVVFNTDLNDFYGFNGTVWVGLWDKTDTLDRFCPDSILYEGQWYTTIQIGTQCWMAENLNVGTQIPGLTYMSNNSVIEKHCFDDIADSCTVYGGLYEWNEMMNYSNTPGSQGICPSGWHIPPESEWDQLSAYLGGNSVSGGHMKTTGYRYWMSPNSSADNSSGFCAIGAGTYRPAGYNYFYLLRQAGIFWTSNPSGSWAIRRDLSHLNGEINPYTCERYHSFSVRCIKNN